MFYEENLINELIICPYCKNKFNDPVIVQCGTSFCHGCVELLLDKQNNGFNCPECEKFHLADKDGFIRNKNIAKLIQHEPKEVYRSKSAQNLKLKLDQVQNKINSLRNDIEIGKDKVKEYCDSIRIEIQLATEIIIDKLKKFNENLLNEIDSYEKDCLENFRGDDEFQVNLDKFINETVQFYSDWKNYLKQVKIDDDEIQKALEEANKCIGNIENMSVAFRNKIFNNNMIKFEKSGKAITSNLIGAIKQERVKLLFEAIDKLKPINIKKNLDSYQPGHPIKIKPMQNEHIIVAYQTFNNINIVKLDNQGNVIAEKKRILEKRDYARNIYYTTYDFKLTELDDKCILFVYYYDEMNDQFKYNLRVYDENLSFVIKEKNLDFNITSICSYKENLYCVTKNGNGSCIIEAFDKDLIRVKKIFQNMTDDKTLAYHLPNTVNKIQVNDMFFILSDNGEIKLMSREDGKITRSFHINCTDFVLYMGDRILKFGTSSKILTVYDLEGNSKEIELKNVPNNYQLIDCVKENLYFYNSGLMSLIELYN